MKEYDDEDLIEDVEEKVQDLGSDGNRKRYKSIFSGLESVREKIEFIIGFENKINSANNVSEDEMIKNAQLLDDMKEEFVNTYIKGKSLDQKREIFEIIGMIDAENAIQMYDQQQSMLNNYAKDDPDRELKAYYLTKNATKAGLKSDSIKMLSTQLLSAFAEDNMMTNELSKSINLSKNTTMKEFAEACGFSNQEDVEKYWTDKGVSPDSTVFEYFSNAYTKRTGRAASDGTIMGEMVNELFNYKTTNWLLNGQRQSYQKSGLDQKGLEGVANVISYNRSSANVNHLKDWVNGDAKNYIDINSQIAQKSLTEEFDNQFSDRMIDYQKNLRQNDLSNINLNAKKLLAIKEIVLAELRAFRGELSLSQDNPEANFYGDAVEGSAEYKAMTNSVKDAIALLERPNVDIGDVNVALASVMDNTQKYHTAKDGILGPRTDKGIFRFKMSDNIVTRCEELYNSYNATYSAYKEMAQNYNINLNNIGYTSFNDFENNLEQELDKLAKGTQIKDPNKEIKEYENNLRIEMDRKALFKAMDGKNQFSNQHPGEYDPDQTTNPEKAAKNYLFKKFANKAMSPDVTSEELRDMQYQSTGKEFDKLVDKLSNNLLFRDIVKKHPDRVVELWGKIEKDLEELRKLSEETVHKAKNFEGREKGYVMNNGIDEKTPVEEIAKQRYKNLADIVESRLLSDPSAETFRTGIVAFPNKKEALDKYVESYVKNYMRVNAERTSEAIDDMINDRKLSSNLIKGFTEAQKQAEKRAGVQKVLDNQPQKAPGK